LGGPGPEGMSMSWLVNIEEHGLRAGVAYNALRISFGG